MFESLKNKFKKKRLLHKNINFLLETMNLDSKTLSSATGIPEATISRIKKENNNPTLSTLEPIANFFRIDLDDLLYEDISSNDYQIKKRVGYVQYIPVICLNEIKDWPISFDSKFYLGTVGNLNANSFGINIDTDSLSPIFYKNTVVIVDPAITQKDTDYIFCTIGNDPVPVFRQFFSEGSSYFLKPISTNFGEMTSAKKFKTLGVIVKSIEHYRC